MPTTTTQLPKLNTRTKEDKKLLKSVKKAEKKVNESPFNFTRFKIDEKVKAVPTYNQSKQLERIHELTVGQNRFEKLDLDAGVS